MSTVAEYMDKTAGYGWGKDGFSKFQGSVKESIRKGTEAFNANNKIVGGKLDDAAKGIKKLKKKVKQSNKDSKKNSLMYGGGAGVAGGYGGAKLSGGNDEEL